MWYYSTKTKKTTPIKWKCTSVLVHFRRLFRFYFMWNAFLLFDRSVVFWELFVVCVEFWILFGHKFCRFDKLTAYYQFLIRQQDKRWNYFVCKIMHIYVLRLMCRSISWKHCKYGFFFLHKNLMISTWMKLNAFIAITQSVLFLSFSFLSVSVTIRNKVVDWASLNVTNWTYLQTLLHHCVRFECCWREIYHLLCLRCCFFFLCNYGLALHWSATK